MKTTTTTAKLTATTQMTTAAGGERRDVGGKVKTDGEAVADNNVG
jgi:hypothetical protein